MQELMQGVLDDNEALRVDRLATLHSEEQASAMSDDAGMAAKSKGARRKSGVAFAPQKSSAGAEAGNATTGGSPGNVNPMAAMRGSSSASTSGFGRAQGLRGLRKDQKSSMASRRAAVQAPGPDEQAEGAV